MYQTDARGCELARVPPLPGVAGLLRRPLPKAEAMPEPAGEISDAGGARAGRNKEQCERSKRSSATMFLTGRVTGSSPV